MVTRVLVLLHEKSPFSTALERQIYICSAVYYRLVTCPVFLFLVVVSAAQTQTDVHNELIEPLQYHSFNHCYYRSILHM